MKKVMMSLMLLVAAAALAGSAVEPPTCTITNVREEAIGAVSAGTIYRGSSLSFTNCALYSGTSATGTVQQLTNVIVQVSVGNLETNIDYTASSTNAALGLWNCTIVVPDLSSWVLQVKITDENTNSYIYANKSFSSELSMF